MAYNPNFSQGQGYGGYPPDQQQPPPYPYPPSQGSAFPGPGQQAPFHPPPPGIYPGGQPYGAAGAYPQQPGFGMAPTQQGPYGQQYPLGPPPPGAFHFPPPEHHQPKPEDVSYAIGGDASGAAFDFDDKNIRRGFIRKVYSILMIQLAITVGFIALFTTNESMKLWTRQNPGFFIGALVMTIVLMLAMACCESVRRKSPGNMICLLLFTVCEGFVLGVASSTYKADAVLLAAGITCVVCLALTAFSFQTKWDFTAHGGILFVAVIVLFIFGILAAFLRSRYPIIQMVYACLGALIFSIYLVYDTQMMMGGKHKYSISPEEYIFAALNLYLDIVQIFLYILTIIGSSSND